MIIVATQAGSTLEWSVISTDNTGANTTICHKSQPLKVAVPQGPGTTVVEGALHCSLPDLGDFQVFVVPNGDFVGGHAVLLVLYGRSHTV